MTMNYATMFKNTGIQKARVGIIGANGGFGYSFLAQVPLMGDSLSLRAICDLDAQVSMDLLKALGYDRARFCPCSTQQEIAKHMKQEDAIIILEDGMLLPFCGIDVLVEATGVPETSSVMAENALLHDIHVCMVSKEADCVSGPYLYKLATSRNLVYAITAGDQPANLIQFLSWIDLLGLEVIAAGKSSEYDFVYDLDSADFTFQGRHAHLPELAKHWHLEGMKTLAQRSRVLQAFPQFAVPDYCEMNVVANATGLVPSCDRFHYPVCRVSELADIYIPVEDGGVLTKTGVVDVFNNLRRPDEASFAGGVFVIVKCHNEKVWSLLAEKGHIVSQNGKYACMYLPYHFMGVEAPVSVVNAFRLGLSTYAECEHVAVMCSRATRDFTSGERLSLNGHHRLIDDVEVSLVCKGELPSDVAPFYLLAEKTLTKDVAKGSLFTFDMVDLSDSELYRMYKESSHE
jgi:predicted homoserine dehydrogenase-like protein